MSEFERPLIEERFVQDCTMRDREAKFWAVREQQLILTGLRVFAPGCSWRTIVDELGVAVSVAFKAYQATARRSEAEPD